ncbi:hypothetical protein MAFF241648_14490 [Ralstonia solanacearum]|nr:hypothetical protein MAFF241648_14490 [Ralstonia solanacearum]
MSKTIDERIKALKERIEADTTKLQELEATKAAADRLASIGKGTIIRYVYGRKETRGEFVGEVRGVIDTEKGRIVRVIRGKGADEEIVSIRPADIVSVAEETTQAETSTQTALVDPLADIQ